MAIFPVSSLSSEKLIELPPPKPRVLKLPPPPKLPPATPGDPGTTRVVARTPPQQQRPMTSATRAAVRQQAERDTRQASAERTSELSDQTILLPFDGQGGQGRGGSNGGERERGRDDNGEPAGAVSRDVINPAADDIDCHMLAGLLPTGGDDGIFEVLLPCGGKLGVAVDVGQRSTSFLLMPSTERLRTQIKKKKMELENALEQRMETQVRLTVL